MEEEIWKSVVDYEGFYEVSNFGRVRSIYRKVGRQKGASCFLKGKILSLSTNQKYATVWVCKYGTRKRVLVHRLVAKAFIPNPDNKETVNHIDGNKYNNVVSNLEWTTHQENITHAHKTGLCKKRDEGFSGESNITSKLKNEDVRYIKKMSKYHGGTLSNKELGEILGVSRTTVYAVVVGRSWKHIT